MLELALTRGYVTTIDDEDEEILSMSWGVNVKSPTLQYVLHQQWNKRPRCIKMHRLIMERMLGRELIKGELVDHADCNGLNNLRSNLRLASKSTNGANRPLPVNNTSGYKGVYWNKIQGRWQAQICIQGKRIGLGLYNTPEEGAVVYNAAALEHFGAFAYLNPIKGASNE